ncbi:MAG: PHP domain-containing protein [Gammaproteobacteria bacterium]|nr:PHP domain-containing protein [Gammaproteobacteria bacterium]
MSSDRLNPALRVFDACSASEVVAADFHMHTTWTDGSASVVDMHCAAIAAGLGTVLFSEHARASSGDWFGKFAAEVRALPAEHCKALVGAEVKVLNPRGELDISNAVRRECALVMASVHRFPGETDIRKGRDAGYSEEQAIGIEFELARAALRAGGFDILGHPFGMAYRRFGWVPPQHLIRELARECARAGIAFEVNARYHDRPADMIALCREEKAPISLGSNAHAPEEVGRLQRVFRSVPS